MSASAPPPPEAAVMLASLRLVGYVRLPPCYQPGFMAAWDWEWQSGDPVVTAWADALADAIKGAVGDACFRCSSRPAATLAALGAVRLSAEATSAAMEWARGASAAFRFYPHILLGQLSTGGSVLVTRCTECTDFKLSRLGLTRVAFERDVALRESAGLVLPA